MSLAEIGLRDMLDLEFWYWIASQWKLAIPAFIGSFFISIVLAVLAYIVALSEKLYRKTNCAKVL